MPDDLLTERQALIIQLHYADGWSLRRIARGIGCDSASVSRSHACALEHLRAYCATQEGPFCLSDVITVASISVEGE